jgi:putative ABC transport system permease protein
MHARDLVHTALTGVSRNRSRAVLTMLGIIVGVASVVLMSSVGASMRAVILSQISSLGPKSMVIFPGQQEGGPNAVSTGFDSLTFDDLDALRKLTTIETVAPVIFLPGSAKFGREEGSPRTLGVTPDFFSNQNIGVTAGRLIDDRDVDGGASVAMLGPDVVRDLFGSRDPLGQRVQIGNTSFTVVGIVKPIGSQFFQNIDDRIYVPFSVARAVTGQKYINYMTMQSTGSFDIAFQDVKWLLRDRHKIDNPNDEQDKDDFVVRSSAQANQILGTVSLGLTAFITTIAAISVIVGGIGIMNIMLVSVTERTMEIGLRKALGAQSRDILRQFLIESVLLTFLGGIIGLVLGIGSALLLSLVAERFLSTYAFAVSLPSVAVALVMAGATGLIFGISPARKAATLRPIEALRYE